MSTGIPKHRTIEESRKVSRRSKREPALSDAAIMNAAADAMCALDAS